MVSLVLQQVCQNSASPMDTCCLLIMKTWLIVLWLSFWIAQPSGNRRHHSALIFFSPTCPRSPNIKNNREENRWSYSVIYVKHSVHLETYVQELQSSSGQNSLPKKKKKLISLKKIVLRTFLVKWKVFKKKKKSEFLRTVSWGEIMNTDFKVAPFT